MWNNRAKPHTQPDFYDFWSPSILKKKNTLHHPLCFFVFFLTKPVLPSSIIFACINMCFSVYLSVRLSVCQSRAFPRDQSSSIKLGSPNLDQSCKTVWLRSLLFGGGISLCPVCHHGTDHAQYWHLAVTCNVTVAIVKTSVIVWYLPCTRSQIIYLRAL